jgi:NitT/TauT family transport system permease protein
MAFDFGATLLRTGQAFAIATVIGVPLGVALGSSEPLYRSVEFLIDFFRSTPSSALIPLFMLFFGITDFNKVAIAAFAAVLVVMFNSAYGVMNAKRTRIMAAQVMGASRWQTFRDVLLWESLPQTFIGLRSGISLALVIVVVAEMFIGSANGMGRRIIDAQQIFDLRQMYASIIATGCLGYGLNLLFLTIERRFLDWSGR